MAEFTFPYTIMADNSSPENYSFGPNDSQASIIIRVPFAEVFGGTRTVIDEILGYTELVGSGGTGPPSLQRHLPHRLPSKAWLWAQRITNIKGIQANGREDSLVIVGGAPYAKYVYADLHVTYSTLDYDVLPDRGMVGNEWLRYTTWKEQDNAEFIQKPSASFTWVAGTPLATTSFRRPMLKLVVKSAIVATWRQIPHAALYGPRATATGSKILSSNIRNGYGKINDAAFCGFPAGTLLCSAGAKVMPWTAPVPPILLGLQATQPPRMYDVEFVLSYFNPPTAGAVYGWNLFPQPTASVNWELATSNGDAATGTRLYETYDFRKFFEPTTT